jgi:hypothetical protein
LVLQAALFAGFLSSFLIELLGRLEQDPLDIIQDVLIYQTQMMRNSSLEPYVPADFSPPEYIVAVNALFYASLSVMLLAALISMLIKSWVREFDRGLRAMSLPEQRAKTREFRYLGLERWKLPEMVGILPLLIQISLLLFTIGLVLFLFHVSKPSFGVTTVISGIGFFFYAMTTSISVFVTASPFHSPLSRGLCKVYQHVHAYFSPCVHVFQSRAMDTTPATALGRLRRYIQIILQKSRPYLEKDFEDPIAAATTDEVQLSTVASALQRIHESVPNSQHSEALQWSVWQVAGSPALRIPPSFNLPSWILDRWDDEEYFSNLPPAMLVALGVVSLRTRRQAAVIRTITARAILQRVDNPKLLWVQLLKLGFDYEYGRLLESNIKSIIRGKELHRDESLWLLSTLSELLIDAWLPEKAPFFIGICLEILLSHVPKWNYDTPPDIVLLEAVVTLASISCSPNPADRRNILTSSRELPWLLLNTRNTNLITTLFEGTHSDHHKQLISLLFLVVYALICRDSYPLAVQYFIIITAKSDLPLYTSALTAIAPSLRDRGLFAMGRMLVAPKTRELTSIISDSMHPESLALPGEPLTDYDHQLGASENPDPNLFAIFLILSQSLFPRETGALQGLDLELENPWLGLAARMVAPLDIPDGSAVPVGLFNDHRVHNMIAALFLLRYSRRDVTPYIESLLPSFLESRELSISSVALEYYMKTKVSNPDPLPPPCSLSRAVRAVFNLMLPGHLLRMGWVILRIFVNGIESLPVKWRRTFAEAFFTLSHQPLPRIREGTETNTPEGELENILTWGYFHEEEQEPEFTESDFSGLDWMAMAWSLHLSQRSTTKIRENAQRHAKTWDLVGPIVNEEFVLRALCMLLDAAPDYQLIPIIPKLREFVHWFGHTTHAEFRDMIFARIEEAVHRRFLKFHCSLRM